MKNFLIAFLAFTCMSICMVKATNYTGTLVVKVVDGAEVTNQESTVAVTLSGDNATLKINSFSFAGIPVPMNITLNCKYVNGALEKPATLTVDPAIIITPILGKLELTTLTGTVGSGCVLNMSVYSPNLNQNILITFN